MIGARSIRAILVASRTAPGEATNHHARSLVRFATRHIPLFATILMLVFVSVASAAPKPWQWTPVHAAHEVIRANPKVYEMSGRFTVATCTGVGSGVDGRFTAFRCSYTFRPHRASLKPNLGTLWAKVRPSGQGRLCVSRFGFSRIPAACLAVKVSSGIVDPADADPETEVRRAVASRLDPSGPVLWQSFTRLECSRKSAGVYDCSFGEGVTGTATVTYYARGPLVTFTALSCSDKVRAWVESKSVTPGCSFP